MTLLRDLKIFENVPVVHEKLTVNTRAEFKCTAFDFYTPALRKQAELVMPVSAAAKLCKINKFGQ